MNSRILYPRSDCEVILVRAYLSVDLEGINGIVHSSQTQPGEPGYERAVALMHQETNAVIEGLVAAGYDDVLVNDAHWDARNLRVELLHPNASLISGWQRPYSMVAGLESASEFDKPSFACFIGYHCRSGNAHGVLSHTYRAQVFRDVELNGKPVGETGLNAALAGWFGVPLALVTGDSMLKKELEEEAPGVAYYAVKESISRYSAKMKPHKNVLSALTYTAENVAKNQAMWKLFKPPAPSTIRITMVDTAMADAAELMPGVQRLNDRQIEFSHQDFSLLFRMMLAAGALGASRRDSHFS